MTRTVLVHDRPNGAEPEHEDRLTYGRKGYAIEWSAPKDGTATDVTTYRDAASALTDWYMFPRRGERLVGRQPRGFEAARRKAKGEAR